MLVVDFFFFPKLSSALSRPLSHTLDSSATSAAISPQLSTTRSSTSTSEEEATTSHTHKRTLSQSELIIIPPSPSNPSIHGLVTYFYFSSSPFPPNPCAWASSSSVLFRSVPQSIHTSAPSEAPSELNIILPIPYLGQQLSDHPVPLAGVLVALPVLVVVHPLERVIEFCWGGGEKKLYRQQQKNSPNDEVCCSITEYVGNLLDEVGRVALEDVVALQPLGGLSEHGVGRTLKKKEKSFKKYPMHGRNL